MTKTESGGRSATVDFLLRGSRSASVCSARVDVRDRADGIDQPVASLEREVDEANPHPGVRIVAQHAQRVHPLDLAGEHEGLARAGRLELERDAGTHLERLVRSHED